jgi:hypothetical protein
MLVFGLQMGFSGLVCRVWVKWARKKCAKKRKNLQKFVKKLKKCIGFEQKFVKMSAF